MGRPIDAESLLDHARQTVWWFIHKFLPAALADEPTLELEENF